MKCESCEFDARSRAGLASHVRREHPAGEATGANAKAIEVTLTELRRMGRLEEVDQARIQAVRSMAEALDVNPFNSQMWREYREAVGGLTADDSNAASGAVDDLLDELSASVRDQAQA